MKQTKGEPMKAKVSLIRRTGGRKSSSNMLIHGENLATLAALKAGALTSKNPQKFEMIYIDPPYNVGGNQGYKNIWKGKSEKERDWAGDHGVFLDFMEPRLKIAQQLLKDDGIIYVSICDGEYARLKILMNQIFGEENEICSFIWDKGRGSHSKQISVTHEYVLCYAKNKSKAPQLKEKKTQAEPILSKAKKLLEELSFDDARKEFKKWIAEEKRKGNLRPGEAVYNEICPKSKRVYRIADSCAQDDINGSRCKKALVHPVTRKSCPIPKNGWKWKEETLDKLVKADMIYFGKDHNTIPKVKKFLDEKMYQNPLSIIYEPSDGANDLPKGISFTTPKPIKLLMKLISFYPSKEIKVLDFFAGSAATAHAVIKLNEADGGSRSYVMVEEMASTFNKVLLPRLEQIDSKQDFSTYETELVPVGGKDLLKMFSLYSYDFLSAYHLIEENSFSASVQGMNIVGLDKGKNEVVAFTLPNLRSGKKYFTEELSAIKNALRATKAKSVVIYTLKQEESLEEPWIERGLK